MKLRRYLIALTAVGPLAGHGGFRLDGAYLRHQMDTLQPHTVPTGGIPPDDARGVADNVLLYQKNYRRLAQEHTYAHGYERC